MTEGLITTLNPYLFGRGQAAIQIKGLLRSVGIPNAHWRANTPKSWF